MALALIGSALKRPSIRNFSKGDIDLVLFLTFFVFILKALTYILSFIYNNENKPLV
jgi:hypothetical protein